MKIFLLTRICSVSNILFCVILSLTGSVSQAEDSPAGASDDAFSQCRRLGRGVNVLGYDPIWESNSKAHFKLEHFKIIREGGFKTLRVNLYPYRHMGDAPEFRLSDSWWRTTDWVVSNALSAGLNVILDLHEYEAHGKDAEGNRDRLLAFWRQVSPHFKNAPSGVFFEILNEPNGKMTPRLWNQNLAEALAIIRADNSSRDVIVGPALWNSVDHLEELKLPDQDRNLIVTVHYYKPMAFTHQGASWAAAYKDKVGVEWKGTLQEQSEITSDFQKVQAWSKQNNRPILLGEFGAYDKGDIASRVRYTYWVAQTAERLGWSWAYWQFDSDFMVYDISKNQWYEPIYRALIPQGGDSQANSK